MKICSFLPSATEMVCALGLESDLVGVTHECDYPPGVDAKPHVVRSVLPTEHLMPAEVDRQIAEQVQAGQSLYQIDEALIRRLAPDLILAQDLCKVCAPSSAQAQQARALLATGAQVAYLTPRTLDEILGNVLEVGRLTGREGNAENFVKELRARLDRVAEKTRNLPRRRVFFMEWVDPVYTGGHWVPEMIALAGGEDRLGSPGKDSSRILWERVLAYQPEVLIISPCGFHAAESAAQALLIKKYPGWEKVAAVQSGEVYAVDASAYFARPGPRVVEGVELLAHLLHPEACFWRGPADAFRRVDTLKPV